MSLFWISFKKTFAYRSSVIFSVLGSVFNLLITMALWTYVYRYDDAKQKYMLVYVILSTLIDFCYHDGMCDSISKRITSGNFAIDLIRPMNFMLFHYWQLLGEICSIILLRGGAICVIFLPILIQNLKVQSTLYVLFTVLAILCGHFLYILLYSMIGYLAFYYYEVWPFQRLMEDTIRFLSGSFIPLTLFSGVLKKIVDVLPFRFLFSFPIEILLGDQSLTQISHNFAIMAVWMVILTIMLICVMKRAVYKCVIQGG